MKFIKNGWLQRVALFIMVGLLGLAWSSHAEEIKMKNVILLGDSIRMGYQKQVAIDLKGKAEVWAPTENCQDSAFIIKSLGKWMNGKSPDLIYINCGLHDIFIDNGNKCRRTPEAYGKNLDTIFTSLRRHAKNAVIIFALTTPVDEAKQKTSKTYGRLVRRNTDVAIYNAKATDIASKYGIKIDDLNTVLKQAGGGILLLPDGIHPDSEGAKLLGHHVADTIERAIQ